MLNLLVAAVLAQESPSPSPTSSPSQLIATPATLGLHPGATASARIANAAGTLSATDTGTLLTVTVDQTTQTVTVTAAGQLGRDTIHVSDQTGAAVDIPVLVAQDAASVPALVTLKITGTPIDPSWLSTQIAAAISRATLVQPGATLTAAPVPSLAPPAVGSSANVAVPVTVAGNGTYLDVAATANVEVQNIAVEPFAPPTLMYDDDPERVQADGVLYRGVVNPGAPSRLYYYHDNGSDPRRLVVVLSARNAGTSAQVIDSSSGPNIDVMSVGHAASRNFLMMKPRNQSVVYDLPEDAPFVLHDLAMTSRQGVAGVLGVNVVSGGPVSVTVLAVSPGIDPRTLLDAPLLPRDGHHRTGVFALTNYGTDSLAYAVGGNDTSIAYADREPTPQNVDPASDGHDYGDYGVVHTFLFSLSNPTASPSNVYLYERPIGGVVRSSFIVDGNLVEMGCVRDKATRYQVAAFALQPNQRYQLAVQTMTDGGSNYPIELGLTGVAPQPTTPPISAADGCFPKPQPVPAPSPF